VPPGDYRSSVTHNPKIQKKFFMIARNPCFDSSAWTLRYLSLVAAALGTVWPCLPAAAQQRQDAAAQAAALQPGIVLEEFIFDKAPFAQCHASTIAQTPGGLVAAWFGGTREKNPDVGIWVARHDGTAWSAPQEVANGVQDATTRYPCWNPVLFAMPDGPLLLFYKVGPSPSTWWGMLMRSSDHGRTWSAPVRLPEGIAGPIKNKPVLLEDGRLLCGSSTEDQGWRVHMEWTRDGGQTWERTQPLCDGMMQAAIQPTILRHGARLQILCRNRAPTHLWESWSEDGGRTWSPLSPVALPHPGSGIDGVTLADGRQLLVYNHTRRGRTPLNVAVSRDGRQWQAALVLEKEPGEYSYPAVIQTSDGRVHITYTWRRERIKHVVLDPSKLATRPIVDGQWPSGE
jgi:predicted neuraminidase